MRSLQRAVQLLGSFLFCINMKETQHNTTQKCNKFSGVVSQLTSTFKDSKVGFHSRSYFLDQIDHFFIEKKGFFERYSNNYFRFLKKNNPYFCTFFRKELQEYVFADYNYTSN